ncbi:MAG: insulinase family protein [Rickettsiales bacterium]|jgi:predicted Zn-dependent peptidase|nr:insulinase family protein [Rickettsiales bacterium]
MKRKLPIYLLPNGMRVVIDNIKTVETVSLGMFVRAGSRDEKENKQGVAHFLEHMIFKGCKTKDDKDVVQNLEDVGGQVNAFTTRESTAFTFKVMKQNCDMALKMLANVFMQPKFSKKDLEIERKVILQEIAQDDNQLESVFDNEMTRLAFGNQSLGQKVIGTKKDIEKITVQDLYDFMNANYCSQKCVLCVCGNVDEKKLLDKIVKLFDKWSYVCPYKIETSKYIGGNKLIKNNGDQVYVQLTYPAPSYENIRAVYTAKLLKMALTGGITARLYRKLRTELGLVYNIKCSYFTFTDNGLFSIFFVASKNNMLRLMKVLKSELNTTKNILTSGELKKIKAQIRAGISFEMEGTQARIIRNAYQILFYNDLYPVQNILDIIDSIKESDIEKMAKKIFSSKCSQIVYGPKLY